jgi:hypothetical protein
MWKVYWDIFCRILQSLRTALYGIEAAVGVAIWAVGSYFPAMAAWIESVTGLEDRWLWVPLGLIVLHLVFKAVYDRNVEWEKAQNDRIESIGKNSDALAVAKFEAKRRDLEDLKHQLYKHLDAPPFLDPFNLGAAQGWAAEATAILKTNVKDEIAKDLPSYLSFTGLSGLREWIAICRSITTGLRAEDLRR